MPYLDHPLKGKILCSSTRELEGSRGREIEYRDLGKFSVTATEFSSEMAFSYAKGMVIEHVEGLGGDAVVKVSIKSSRVRDGYTTTITGIAVKTKRKR